MANYYAHAAFAPPPAAELPFAAVPGTPPSDSDSHASGPLPTDADLAGMSAEQLAGPLDPQLFMDLRGMAPAAVNALMAPTVMPGAAIPPSQVPPNVPAQPPPPPASAAAAAPPRGAAPPPLGVAPPLGAGLTGRTRVKREDSDVERREQRKQLRAERNRQSAASSRERKKRHLRELGRRLELLKTENTRIEEELALARQRMAHELTMLERKDRAKKKLDVSKHNVAELQDKIVTVAAQHRAGSVARKGDGATVLAPPEAAAATPQVASPVPAVSPTTPDDGRPKVLRKPRTWDSNALGDASRKFAF